MKNSNAILSLCRHYLPALLLLAAGLHTQAETVTFLLSESQSWLWNPPQATSSAYTNTYSVQGRPSNYPPTNSCWTVEIRAGEVCKVVGNNGDVQLYWQTGSATNSPFVTLTPSAVAPFIVVGPGRVFATLATLRATYVTLSITRLEDFISPQNALAIPADTAGPVTVSMESSTNGGDWVAASPGTYGISDGTRFFRLRALRTPN